MTGSAVGLYGSGQAARSFKRHEAALYMVQLPRQLTNCGRVLLMRIHDVWHSGG